MQKNCKILKFRSSFINYGLNKKCKNYARKILIIFFFIRKSINFAKNLFNMKKISYTLLILFISAILCGVQAQTTNKWNPLVKKMENKNSVSIFNNITKKQSVINQRTNLRSENLLKNINRNINIFQPITLPLNNVLLFNETNTTEIWNGSGYYGFGFTFTLTETQLLTFSSDAGVFFCIYDSPNVNGSTLFNGSGSVLLAAGTYYLTIDNNGMPMPFSTQINSNVKTIPTIPLTVPFDNNITLDINNTYEFEGQNFVCFEFTLSVLKKIHFNNIEDILCVNYYGCNNFDAHLAAGTSFFVTKIAPAITIDEFGHVTDLKIDEIDISVIDITIPYNESITLEQGNVYNDFGYYGKWYSFEVIGNDISVEIASSNSNINSVLFSQNLYDIANGNSYIRNLIAGNYFLYVFTKMETFDTITVSVPEISTQFTINTFFHYTELDYSTQLIAGAVQTGNNTSLSLTYIDDPSDAVNAKDFFFNATAGNIYTFTYDAFTIAPDFYLGFILLRDVLDGTHDDFIYESGNFYNSTSVSNTITWICTENQTIKLLFATDAADIFYNLKMTVNSVSIDEPTAEDFSFVDITLPFASTLHFEPGYNTLIDYDTIPNYYGPGQDSIYVVYAKKGFRLEVENNIKLNYVIGHNDTLGWASPLNIYEDENLTQQVGGDLWAYDEKTLQPGTYYLIFCDDWYCVFNHTQEFYICDVFLTETILPPPPIGTITLKELFDDPAITVVDYDTDLPFAEVNYYVTGYSAIVAGQSGLFRYSDNYYYANAYKLTGMNTSDLVHIHHAQTVDNSLDTYLYLYEYDGTTITYINHNDDGGGNSSALIDFTAIEDDVDYYIVATTYNSYENLNGSSYQVTVWKTGTEPEPTDTIYPTLATILSTTASETIITFSQTVSNYTEQDIRIALYALTLTATTSNSTTPPVINNPLSWTIASNLSQATFDNLNILGYTIDPNYSPAVVNFEFYTPPIAISEDDVTNLKLYPNPASDYINIDGLSGGEKITIFDINGRIVEQQFAASNITLNVSKLQYGTYIVIVQKNNEMKVLKFIK